MCADGSVLDLDDYPGRWVVLNYWAPWCAPCREEIPVLNDFAETNAARVLVLGVHLDGVRGERLAEDIEDLGIRFPVAVADPGPVLGLRPSAVVPTTWILNPQGEVHRMLLGPQSARDLYDAIGVL